MDPLIPGLLIGSVLLSATAVVLAIVMLTRRNRANETALQDAMRAELRDGTGQLRQDLAVQRNELGEYLGRSSQAARLAEEQLKRSLTEQLTALRQENETKLEKVRQAVDEKLQALLTTALGENADRIQALTKANSDKHVELQALLREELDKLRKENETKLEQMRLTVDEKLQGTLEKRLGESFKLVSDQLDLVSKGLGEMQTLAADVGGLKRVLTNVKSRGTWGEVQLARQLEDALTRDQYEANVAIRPGSGERVEFALRLPGRSDDEPVYLPIDSKFPREDFDRLQEAQDAGDKSAVDAAAAALERAVLEQAKTISAKYIDPPHSTDFAIMYLPFESLFAEVVRRPGLMEKLQHVHRVQVSGPSTLMAYLNALQMGFRTLLIEKRSSEVWKVLGAAKNEFTKYGQVMDRLKRQLGTAQNTVDLVGTRTRAINRALKQVEVSDDLEPLVLDASFEDDDSTMVELTPEEVDEG